MDEFDMMLARDFIAENWSAWESFCAHRDQDAQEVYEALGGEPD